MEEALKQDFWSLINDWATEREAFEVGEGVRTALEKCKTEIDKKLDEILSPWKKIDQLPFRVLHGGEYMAICIQEGLPVASKVQYYCGEWFVVDGGQAIEPLYLMEIPTFPKEFQIF